MIHTLLSLGSVAALLAWIAGLSSLWSGRPKLSLASAGGWTVAAILLSFSAFLAPRNARFWLGEAAGGDGFGQLGLVLFGFMVAGISAFIFIASLVLYGIRAKKLGNEVSE